nr:hypothetical protein [uncultured Roseateles sp.]
MSHRHAMVPLARRGLTALGLLLTLSACGGGSAEIDHFVKDTTEASLCVLYNCTESDTVVVGDISPKYVVTQSSGGQVHVAARLGKTANLLTVVRPTKGDTLTASLGGQQSELRNIDKYRMDYAVDFADGSAQPSVVVNFVRAGEAHASSVTMPAPFRILSPTGPINLGRQSGFLWVRMDLAGDAPLSLQTALSCVRADGSSFKGDTAVPSSYDANANGGPAWRVSTLDLDLALNNVGLGLGGSTPNKSPVQSCELDFNWLLSKPGKTAATLSKYSSIRAERSAGQHISYDARL